MKARVTLAIVLALALAGAAAATALGTATGIDTFVSRGSPDYQATQLDARQFGGDPVVVLVREPLTKLIEPAQLKTVLELETCLAGQLPHVAGACSTLASERPAKVVYGPGTFLNHAVTAVQSEINSLTAQAAVAVKHAEAAARRLATAQGLNAQQTEAAAAAAGKLALSSQLGRLSAVAKQAALSGSPSISDTAFLKQIVFGSATNTEAPDPRFSYVFPSADAAVIQVRLRAGLSDAQQSQAIAMIRSAVGARRFALAGGSYLVSGEPVLLDELAGELGGQLALLLVGSLVVMGLVLLLVFRRAPRLLPLAIAVAAVAITLGLAAAVGESLTIASVAVLPVLIGLGVDYGIQVQSGTRRQSVGVAAVATAVGFLVLLLSPVPMVRGFGMLLVVGVAIAFACALLCVPAALELYGTRPTCSKRSGPRRFASIASPLFAAARGAGEIVGDGAQLLGAPLRRVTSRRPDLSATIAFLTRRPGRVLLIGLALALVGWGLGTRTAVQSDLTKLVPADMPALRNLNALEDQTGVSGEVDVLVHGNNVATPQAIGWMDAYEQRVLRHFGYTGTGGCAQAKLCPALSLPDLFSGSTTTLTQNSINTLLSSVPSYFSEGVVTADRKYASLAFGIRLMPLAAQRQVIDYMRSALPAHPPAGLSVRVAGDPVLAADAEGALSSSSRRLLTILAGLLAVAVALLLALRDVRRALIPLVPIVLATGWSALILYLIRVPLNPMSATLGALVIAISTEFSVLLSERVRSERADGSGAVERAYRSTGAAVTASGVTAIAGFGVLVLSDVPMLRDFGWVTVVDMSVSLLGVLAVLPAVLTLMGPRAGALQLRSADGDRLEQGPVPELETVP